MLNVMAALVLAAASNLSTPDLEFKKDLGGEEKCIRYEDRTVTLFLMNEGQFIMMPLTIKQCVELNPNTGNNQNQ